MHKPRRLSFGFAAFGLVIAGALFAYLEFTDYSPLNPTLRIAALILCLTSPLSILSFDFEPHTIEVAFIWSIVGLTNAALYGAIGAALGRYLGKSGSSTTP